MIGLRVGYVADESEEAAMRQIKGELEDGGEPAVNISSTVGREKAAQYDR